jgi:aspartyl-tRNA(Asn)/glutamyl-tRNA(Gln) amidotransferase subunit C
MSLTTAQVKKIAKLARIRLSDEEVDHYGKEISNILNWIETLQEVNTDKVPQMLSVSSVGIPLRADEVTDGDMQADILKNAPKSSFGCFEVPKVVE